MPLVSHQDSRGMMVLILHRPGDLDRMESAIFQFSEVKGMAEKGCRGWARTVNSAFLDHMTTTGHRSRV